MSPTPYQILLYIYEPCPCDCEGGVVATCTFQQ